jgi:hypothetical protein
MKDRMLQAYRDDPRPVLWQDQFERKANENNRDALARCYAGLLARRERLYKRCAHVTLPYAQYRKKG